MATNAPNTGAPTRAPVTLDAITQQLHEHAQRISALAEAGDLMLEDVPRIGETFDAIHAERVARVGLLLRIVAESATVLDDQGSELERYQFAARKPQVQP